MSCNFDADRHVNVCYSVENGCICSHQFSWLFCLIFYCFCSFHLRFCVSLAKNLLRDLPKHNFFFLSEPFSFPFFFLNQRKIMIPYIFFQSCRFLLFHTLSHTVKVSEHQKLKSGALIGNKKNEVLLDVSTNYPCEAACRAFQLPSLIIQELASVFVHSESYICFAN